MPQDDSINPQSTTITTDDGTPLRPDVAMHRAAQKLESSAFYQNLDFKKKLGAQRFVYDKYVTPANNQLGTNISFFDWSKTRFSKGKNVISDNATTTEKVTGAVAHGLNTTLEAGYHAYQAGDEQFNKALQNTKAVSTYVGNLAKGNIQGPVTINPKDTPVKHSQMIEDYFKKSSNWMEAGYDKSFKDRAIKEVGNLAGQAPAFVASDGILEGVGLRSLLMESKIATGSKIAKVGAHLLYNASNGYLLGLGTNVNPLKEAVNWGIGGTALEGVGHYLVAPAWKYAGEPVWDYISKLMGTGGTKLVSQVVSHAKDLITKDAVESKVSPVSVALGGTPKQKISAATITMLNDLVGEGGWSKATTEQRNQAIAKLADKMPELADTLAAANKPLVQAKVQAETLKWRQSVPEANNVLTQLEQLDQTPTVKSITNSVVEKAQARRMIMNPGKVKVGAASADSLEFENNVSKKVDTQLTKLGLGKDKIIFEDRGHKLLFYLNLLMTEQKSLGPTSERNKMFTFVTKHLNERYPEKTLPQLVEMSNSVWTKLENLTKAGYMKEGEPVRFFRQSELRPGESPFGHEIWLLREAAQKENAEALVQQPTPKKSDVSKAPEGKDRRSSLRVSVNDPTSVREMIDMHSMRINMLNKDLSKKGLTDEERSEIQEAIKREERQKTEQKAHLKTLSQD